MKSILCKSVSLFVCLAIFQYLWLIKAQDVQVALPDSAGNEQSSLIAALVGQALQAAIDGTGSFLSILSPVICPVLRRPPINNHTREPSLLVFNDRQNLNRSIRINADDTITEGLIKYAQFDPKANTVILIHGWFAKYLTSYWMLAGKNVALGATEDGTLYPAHSETYRPNVIIVEWPLDSYRGPWMADASVQRVGQRLGRLLRQLVEVGGLKPELMHCIGHSYGAHVCGRAAREAFPANVNSSAPARYGRMGRITGLDPAGLCYELGVKDEATYLGLRPSDALLVDAYNTDRAPFGTIQNVAQYNVRVNNGFRQPTCSTKDLLFGTDFTIDAIGFILGRTKDLQTLACRHVFSTRFIYQNLSPVCSYVAYSCDSYKNFVRGRCAQCSNSKQCYTMDSEYQRANPSLEHFAEQVAEHSSYLNDFTGGRATGPNQSGAVQYDDRRVYHLRTFIGSPYCKMTYRVRVKLSDALDMSFFKPEQLKLQIIDASGRVLSVISATDDEPTTSIGLYGPWKSADQTNPSFGLDERTLTALFELDSELTTNLLSLSADRLNSAPLASVVVTYNMNHNWNQDHALLNPVFSINLDYISSSDRRIRELLSVSLSQKQFTVVYKY